MKILAIDPGTTKSAYILWDTGKEEIIQEGLEENEKMLSVVKEIYCKHKNIKLKIEMVGHYGTGMPAGKSIFETCIWIGIFIGYCGNAERFKEHLVLRKSIVSYICGSSRAKDSNVRQALIDRYGRPGTKKKQGKLYGVKKDIWSALALAVYIADKERRQKC